MPARALHLLAFVLLGCAPATRPSSPSLSAGVWRIRIDVDSTPTRRMSRDPLFGTIDFVAGIHQIDFLHSFHPALPSHAYISPVPGAQTQYRVVLGDSSSFDEKIVMFGRLAGPDSIAGTWTETIVCCSAGGRFSLWRARTPMRR